MRKMGTQDSAAATFKIQTPQFFSNPFCSTHLRRWWLIELIISIIILLSIGTAVFLRPTNANFQHFLDAVKLSDREIQRFLREPQRLADFEDDSVVYTGPSLLSLSPQTVSVRPFNVSLMNHVGSEFAMMEFVAHDSLQSQVSSTITFTNYDVLQSVLNEAKTKLNVRLIAKAEIVYAIRGKEAIARLYRNSSLSPEHLSYLGMHNDVTPLGSTLTELQDSMKQKHKSMLKIDGVRPTTSGFDLGVSMVLRSYKFYADLGQLKAGIYLAAHPLLSADIEAVLHPNVSTFNTKVRLEAGWNETMGHTDVVQYLSNVSRSADPHVLVRVQGEHARRSRWLDIFIRAISFERRLPADFVLMALAMAGMPSLNTTHTTVPSISTGDILPSELFDY